MGKDAPEVITAEHLSSLTQSCKITNEVCGGCLDDISGQLDALLNSNLQMFTDLSNLSDKVTDISQACSINFALKEHTNTLSHTISSSISGLSEKISTIPDGSYSLAIISGIIGAVVAAFAAGMLNFFYWRHVNKENKKSHFSICALEHLQEFEESALKYWIQDKKPSNVTEMYLLEVKILSQFQVLKSSLSDLISQLPESEKSEKDIINTFIGDVYDVATGGDFESSDKKCEKKTTLNISRICSSLKSTLLKFSQQTN